MEDGLGERSSFVIYQSCVFGPSLPNAINGMGSPAPAHIVFL